MLGLRKIFSVEPSIFCLFLIIWQVWVEVRLLVAENNTNIYTTLFAQSAGAVEYTDCTSTEG